MQLYISTGGFNLPPTQIIKKFIFNNINNIEISGGRYEKNLFNKILNFNKIKISIHNYIPFYKKTFVFNLASNKKKILNKSLAMAKKSIDLVSLNKSKFYTFHAGFLFDPKVNMLGDKPAPNKFFNRNVAIKNFVKNVKLLNSYAKKKGVNLLIENNIVSKKQYLLHNYVPLMCDIEETKKIMNLLPKSIKILLDLAHLKVSSNVLGFSKSEYISKLDRYIDAYHLSDNNGLFDQNKIFDKKCWFWEFIKNNKKFCTVEVYKQNIKKLKQLLKLVESKINK